MRTGVDDIDEPADGGPFPDGYTPDPFAPDPTIWPEAPSWLFPTVVVLTIVAVLAVLVLLYLWWKSIQYTKAENEKLRNKEWIDLDTIASKNFRGGVERPARPAATRPSTDAEDDDEDSGKQTS